MPWCPRCDVLVAARDGDDCPSCGAGVIDVASPGVRRGARRVLELERPVVDPPDVEAPGVEMSLPAAAPITRRVFASTIFRAAAAALVLAGGLYTAITSVNDPTPPPSATPKPKPAPLARPPLGSPASGSVIFAASGGLRIIDLEDGAVSTIDPPAGVASFHVSPSRAFVAHLDETRLLTVTRLGEAAGTPVATEVDFYAWAPDGDALFVSRRQVDARSRERWRFELVSIDSREATLLLESSRAISTIMARGESLLIEMYDADGYPNVYEIEESNTTRLIFRRAELLDLRSDGSLAIVGRRDAPGIYTVDVRSRNSRRIGSSKLVGLSARFSPDGLGAALVAVPGSGGSERCEGGVRCSQALVTSPAPLWIVEMETLEMRMIYEPEGDLNRPAWGPNGEWIFLFEGRQPVAVALQTSTPTPLASYNNSTWFTIEYLP